MFFNALMTLISPDVYFFLVVTAATVVKLMNPPAETWREGISATLSAYLCAYVLTGPLVAFAGRWFGDHVEAFTLGVGALMALTGMKIVHAVIRLSSEASETVTLRMVLDLYVYRRTGVLPPSLQFPTVPPSHQLPKPSPEEVQKGEDDVQN